MIHQLGLFPEPARPAPSDLRPEEPDLASYDVILVSTSAGKDSQRALHVICDRAEQAGVRDRVVAVHCNLAEEWPGTLELARAQCEFYGVRLEVERREDTILDYVLRRHRQGLGRYAPWPRPDARFCTSEFKRAPTFRVLTRLTREVRGEPPRPQAARTLCRPPWPDSVNRWCTSDFKRGPVRRVMTRLVQAQPVRHRPVRILHCMGLRAQESPARAHCDRCKNREPQRLSCPVCHGTGARQAFTHDDEASNKTRRHVDTWLPVLNLTTEQVWAAICASGAPYHPIYREGMARLSCVVCIFAPRAQLVLAGHLQPELLHAYADVERRVRYTFRKDLSLQEVLEEVRRTTIDDARRAAAGDADGCWNM